MTQNDILNLNNCIIMMKYYILSVKVYFFLSVHEYLIDENFL